MKKAKVLIVEDEFITAMDLQVHLENLGYAVCGKVNTAEEALELVQNTPCDVILMDIMLKGEMTGIEAASKIRSEYHIPVIYLTANTDPQILAQARTAEPFGFLIKPFHKKELQANIEMALYKHGMEEKLRESEGKYRRVVEYADEGIIVAQGEMLKFVNPKTLDITGYSREQLLSAPFLSFIHPEDVKLVGKHYQNRLQEKDMPESYSARIRHKNGAIKWLEIRAIRIDWEARPAVLSFLIDITERKQTEEALSEQKALLSEVFDGVQEGMALVDEFQNIVFCNPAYEQLVDAPRHTLSGMNAFSFFTSDDRRVLIQKMKESRNGRCSNCELFLTSLKGTKKYVRLTAAPRMTSDGAVIGEFVTMLDITERKRAEQDLENYKTHLEELVAERTAKLEQEILERKRIEETLKRAKENALESQRLAEAANIAKSEFVANMSHELRTPLNGVLGYAQILQHDNTLTEEQQKQIKVIRNSGEHLLTLLNDILDLSKLEAGRLEIKETAFNLSEILKPLIHMIRFQAEKKGLSFKYEEDSGLLYAFHGDAMRLRQILFNLLGNAVKFTVNGEICLRVRRIAVDSTAELPGLESSVQMTIRFDVEDTGRGIPSEQMEKIFMPFEQYSGVRLYTEGPGLGLTLCQRLLHMMGSELKVKSTPDQGSLFWFELVLLEVKKRAQNDDTDIREQIDNSELTIVPPPKEILTKLNYLALIGDIMEIQELIGELSAADSRFEPFATLVSELVESLRIVKIRRLTQYYLDLERKT